MNLESDTFCFVSFRIQLRKFLNTLILTAKSLMSLRLLSLPKLRELGHSWQLLHSGLTTMLPCKQPESDSLWRSYQQISQSPHAAGPAFHLSKVS